MFVRYYVLLPLPFAEVEEALVRSPGEWVPGLARDAHAHGEALLAEVGFDLRGRRIAKQVEITLGEPLRLGGKTLLPMTWRASGAGALFPTLEADLEVASLGPIRTQIALSARYEPPFGAVGRAMDRALLHRVAEATVKDFLDGAAEAVGGLVRSGGRPAAGVRGPSS